MRFFWVFKTLWLWVLSKPSRKGRYVFITGPARSGTTLLKTLLTRHEQFFGCDYESTGFFKLRDFSQYSSGEFSKEEVGRLLRQSDSGLVGAYNLLMEKLSEIYGGSVFVDKAWPGWLRLRFVEKMFPEAKWIQILRDPRDCFASAKKHPNIKQGKSATRYARYWLRCAKTMNTRLQGADSLEIRYEDLSNEPEKTLRKIMMFLEEDFQESQLDSGIRVTSLDKRSHHSGLSKRVNSASIGRYKNELSLLEKERIERACQEVKESFGYL